jgi:hypothetical protein
MVARPTGGGRNGTAAKIYRHTIRSATIVYGRTAVDRIRSALRCLGPAAAAADQRLQPWHVEQSGRLACQCQDRRTGPAGSNRHSRPRARTRIVNPGNCGRCEEDENDGRWQPHHIIASCDGCDARRTPVSVLRDGNTTEAGGAASAALTLPLRLGSRDARRGEAPRGGSATVTVIVTLGAAGTLRSNAWALGTASLRAR